MDKIEITPNNIALVLRGLREQRAESHRRLAAKAGTAFSNISRLEQARILPSFTTLHRLAKALGMRIMLVEDK